MLDGPERRLQRHDRAGPFGGQDLGSLPAGALQLQSALECLNTVAIRTGRGPVRWY